MFRDLFLPLITLAILIAAPLPARADAVTDGFRAFLEADIWPAANARGVPRAVFDAAFKGVTPNLKLPDLQLPGSKETVAETNFQAEFKSGADYLSERAVAANAASGRKLLARYKSVLDRIEARYGVPAPIIVAIWGRESAFGNAKIPENAFEVLGTKAYLSRRKALFRDELLAALEIVADGHLQASQMKSSWAGALGQPQFMSSKFLALAVDFDGDGKKDIWNSVPDTLASIANYLRQSGWQPGRDWGFEAVVPASVSCANEGPDRGRPIAEFVAAGVTRVSGRPFPPQEVTEQGHLMMPAGRFGPAFIATPNFYVIKAYNNSDLYALFVGHVADRMQGAGSLQGRWAKTDRMTRGDVARMQTKLEAKGYDVGGADGLAGFKTRRSIGDFEARAGLPQTCWPNQAIAAKL
ncbi:lytic murein transglycosylase [Aurantimonas sp. C2-6-R+9]|uniref:lytic murein transglycosylase n=1 Tax=unclassified Aurantimonas TaxID=2638230 RepID=UPI002E16E50F|nr:MULTISPECIES: lytic murein transglycosylase [unclassified Aurantimonas]MEC5292055.1 lytic murein transglycosylase [Aurantimonas sp. C2-3-R2]MEC5382191.1 lytic murein transglycosylase [Aurantimonas sp. C2-6-R+9]MEC5413127.1 lytic murein transglycosylase [Aurantimonas sp. C2-4-R8]